MYRLFFVLVVAVAIIVGVGFYFGYLHIGEKTTDGTTDITLTVDQKKLHSDEKKAEQKVHDVVHPSKE
jgi:hypothetical protein